MFYKYSHFLVSQQRKLAYKKLGRHTQEGRLCSKFRIPGHLDRHYSKVTVRFERVDTLNMFYIIGFLKKKALA
jgi:hypothetical protein